jgi:hypothetical protein
MNADLSNPTGATVLSPAPPEAEQCFKSFKNMLRDLLTLQETSGIYEANIHSFTTDPIAQQQRGMRIAASFLTIDTDSAYRFMGSMAISGKSVALTVDGHVCLAPHMSQKGDQIVVVKGLRQPLALRPVTPTGEEWQLVGACYVHGIMRGEIWDSGGGGPWQDLVVV